MPVGIRLYAIGDIHGCATLLDRLHGEIARDLESNGAVEGVVIYLGDYIDRGPDSSGVLEILTTPFQNAFRRVFLKGNHEDMLLKYLTGPDRGSSWCEFGGFETLMSYRVDIRHVLNYGGHKALAEELAARLPASHLQFLNELQSSFSIGDYFFCHAGVRPGISLDLQKPNDLIWIREEFLASSVDHGKIIVHGHTPVEDVEVRPNRIGIDTGAYATGRLTALVLEGEERRFLST